MRKVLIEIKNFTIKCLIFLFFTILFINENLKAFENKILFKIDNELITSIDIYNKSKYLITLDEDIKNLQDEQIFELSKNMIIKEKIKKIALKNHNIDVGIEDKILNSYVKSMFSSKGISNLNDYKKFVENLDLNFELMKENLIINLLWNNLVFNKYSSKIKINKIELKKEIENKKNSKSLEYLLSEIVFEASNKKEINIKFKKILTDIQSQGFRKAALIHSISDSSNNGGNIGWINENSLSKKILNEIINLKVKEHTNPIIIPGGFLILKIEEKKFIEVDFDLDTELNKLVQIKTNQQLNQYSNILFNKIKKEIQIYEYN